MADLRDVIVQNGTLNTNIRLERGDSVTVSATGSIASVARIDRIQLVR